MGLTATILTWIVGLAAAYALIYWPYIERFSFSPEVAFGSKAWRKLST